MLSRKVKVAAPAVAVAGVFAGSAQASVIDYEINVWAIDHSNSPTLASGGTLNAWDGHDRDATARDRGPGDDDRSHRRRAPGRPCVLRTGRAHARQARPAAVPHGCRPSEGDCVARASFSGARIRHLPDAPPVRPPVRSPSRRPTGRLVHAATGADQHAWDELVKVFAVRRVIGAFRLREHQVEDVIQATSLRLVLRHPHDRGPRRRPGLARVTTARREGDPEACTPRAATWWSSGPRRRARATASTRTTPSCASAIRVRAAVAAGCPRTSTRSPRRWSPSGPTKRPSRRSSACRSAASARPGTPGKHRLRRAIRC